MKRSQLPDGEFTKEQITDLYLDCRDHLRSLLSEMSQPFSSETAKKAWIWCLKTAPEAKDHG